MTTIDKQKFASRVRFSLVWPEKISSIINQSNMVNEKSEKNTFADRSHMTWLTILLSTVSRHCHKDRIVQQIEAHRSSSLISYSIDESIATERLSRGQIIDQNTNPTYSSLMWHENDRSLAQHHCQISEIIDQTHRSTYSNWDCHLQSKINRKCSSPSEHNSWS